MADSEHDDRIEQQYGVSDRFDNLYPIYSDGEGDEEMSEEKKSEEAKGEALSFVTRKVLVTFHPHIALLINDNVVMSTAAICEYQETEGNRSMFDSMPKHLTVVSLANGPKITKSIQLHVNGYNTIVAMVELD